MPDPAAIVGPPLRRVSAPPLGPVGNETGGVDAEGAERPLVALERLAAALTVLSELGPLEERALRRRLRRTTSG